MVDTLLCLLCWLRLLCLLCLMCLLCFMFGVVTSGYRLVRACVHACMRACVHGCVLQIFNKFSTKLQQSNRFALGSGLRLNPKPCAAKPQQANALHGPRQCRHGAASPSPLSSSTVLVNALQCPRQPTRNRSSSAQRERHLANTGCSQS